MASGPSLLIYAPCWFILADNFVLGSGVLPAQVVRGFRNGPCWKG